MELTLTEKTAKKLYPESPSWFKEVLVENFGKSTFKKKDWRDIQDMETVYEMLNVNPDDVFNDDDTTDEIAYKKAKLFTKAINQGWLPDWNNSNQRKWLPWFNLSSGFGFSASDYGYTLTYTSVGSRLCFESEEKSDHAAKFFLDIYEDLLTIK